MKKFVSFAMLICVLVLSGCLSFGASKVYKEGIQAIEDGDYRQAESSLGEAIDKGYTKNRAESIYDMIREYNKAASALKKENYEDAAAHRKNISSVYKNFDGLSRDIKKMDKELGKYEDSKDLYDQVIQYYEKNMYEQASEISKDIDDKYLTESQRESLEYIIRKCEEMADEDLPAGMFPTDEPPSEDPPSEDLPGLPNGVKYRVRKSANDVQSQIGAFKEFDNAVALANERKSEGYKVYDLNGNLRYSPQ